MSERFALYFAPSVADPLWTRAVQWLGRDPAGGTIPEVHIPGVDPRRRLAVSESARRYGFHATIKAPMALAAGVTRAALEQELERFGKINAPVEIGRLKVAWIEGFIALVLEQQTQQISRFAGNVVTNFDRFRAPLTPDDRERRLAGGHLSARQVELLDQYGYPYVLEEFRFHMTIADRLGPRVKPGDADRDEIMSAAQAWFAPVLGKSYSLDRIVLFHEPESGAPFVRLGDTPLTAKATADA